MAELKDIAVAELREAGAMHLGDAIDSGMRQLRALSGLETSSVVAATRKDDGWQIIIELIERRAIPDTQDLLGEYEILLDNEGDMISYERRGMRRRMDLMETVE